MSRSDFINARSLLQELAVAFAIVLFLTNCRSYQPAAVSRSAITMSGLTNPELTTNSVAWQLHQKALARLAPGVAIAKIDSASGQVLAAEWLNDSVLQIKAFAFQPKKFTLDEIHLESAAAAAPENHKDEVTIALIYFGLLMFFFFIVRKS